MGASLVVLVGMNKLARTEQFHPDYLLNNHDPAAVTAKVLELTDGIGADIVILAVPSVIPQQQAIDMVRKRGHVVIYGGTPKNREMTTLNSNTLHYNEITITGAFSYPAIGLSEALSAIHVGKISAEKYLNAKVSLEDVVKGMEMSQRGEALKVLIDPWM